LTDLNEGDKTGQWRDFLKQKYRKALGELGREYPFKRSLLIDYKEIERWGPAGIALADELIENPGKCIEDIKDILLQGDLIKTREGVKLKSLALHVRFIHLPKKTRIRDMRTDNVNRFFSCEGMITRISEIRPRMVEAVFRCPAGHFTMVLQKPGKTKEPDGCSTDGCRFRKLDLLSKRSRFVDSQNGLIQESMEGQRPGEQPGKLAFDLEDDLVGMLVPGERLVLNGILRSFQKVVKGEKSNQFDLYLEVNSIEQDQRNYGEIEILPEEETEILKLAKSPDPLSIISQSILPAISGLEEEKKGITLALFSPSQETSCGKKLRGSIHLMLVGDPGISKTTLFLMLKDMTPRAIYISGKSTSSAGLTFTMRQDEFDKRWVADAGAAVLADGSNLFVDELAMMEKGDIMALNEFMESQILVVAKAGLNATLQARCSVLVALNPKFGRFDMAGAPLADQIDAKIPPQLLSRFDLIYIIPDVPEATRDQKEAEDILGLWQGTMIQRENQVPLALMQKYIALAKRRKNPKINDAAKRIIVERFVEIRKSSSNGNITVTKRALESLARLATAHAIMRFGEEVTVKDAEVAIKVFENSQKQVAVDPSGGGYNADRVTGQTKDKRKLADEIVQVIRDQGGITSMDVIIREVRAKNPGMVDNKIRSTIEQMYRENMLMEAGLGKYRVL
jgi:replicative DNA helicase Mcm